MPVTSSEVAVLSSGQENPSPSNFLKILKKTAFYLSGVVAIAAIVIVIGLHSNGRVYPRVLLGPIALGYEPLPEAKNKINQQFEAYLKQPIVFNYGKKKRLLPRWIWE